MLRALGTVRHASQLDEVHGKTLGLASRSKKGSVQASEGRGEARGRVSVEHLLLLLLNVRGRNLMF
jgi:hypothetical protein